MSSKVEGKTPSKAESKDDKLKKASYDLKESMGADESAEVKEFHLCEIGEIHEMVLWHYKRKEPELDTSRYNLKGYLASKFKVSVGEDGRKSTEIRSDREVFADGQLPVHWSLRQAITADFTKNMNKLSDAHQKPEWLKFLEELTGFFALLLWAGAILCFIGFGLRREIDNLYLGIVLSAVVIITGAFSYFQNASSASLMAEFAKFMAKTISVVTDRRPPVPSDPSGTESREAEMDDHGFKKTFDSIYLVVGDVVNLSVGDSVPADIRIISSSGFKVNNSALTGESDTLERGPNNVQHDPKEATNMIFFGTDASEGTCTGVVVRTGDDTFIGKIAQLTEGTEVEQTPINKEIQHFITIVSAVAIFLGVAFFIIGLALGTDLITNLVFMIGIIVANVPEGLLATVTVCLSLTSSAMFQKNVLVKNMESVETLGSTTCICSDKTGTLTQNRMTCAEVLFDKAIFRTDFVEGSGDDDSASLSDARKSDSWNVFFESLCLNTTAKFIAGGQYEVDRHRGLPPKPFFLRPNAASVPEVKWDDIDGDASEASMIKLVQYMHPEVYMRDGAIPTTSSDDDYRDLMEESMYGKDWVAYERSKYPNNGSVNPASEKGVIAFNSRNKYHVNIADVNKSGEGDPQYTVFMKGAPERILSRCDRMLLDGHAVEMTPKDRAEIIRLQNRLMSKGRRVLAFAKEEIRFDEVPAKVDPSAPHPFIGDAMNFPMGAQPGQPDYEGALAKSTELGEEHAADFRRLATRKLILVGMVALIDPPRPAVPDSVLSCQRAGIRVVMVTGDHPQTAAAIAKMVNIFTTNRFKVISPLSKRDDSGKEVLLPDRCKVNEWGEDVSKSNAIVVPGWELSPDTTEAKWRYIFKHSEIVFARTSPSQKLQIVKAFQELEKEVVAVTGDGVNDAPALKKADIGVAMGIAGTEVSKTAADMILLDDNFASIVRGVEEGRLIFDNLKKSIAYTLSSNIPEIAPFLIFITVQTPLPLSTVLILCIDLGTDMVPAISMAWEEKEADIMRRPPRDSGIDRLVTKKLVSFAYLQVGVIQAVAAFFCWCVVMSDYGFPPQILPSLGAFDNWGKQILYCQLDGGLWRNVNGDIYPTSEDSAAAIAAGYEFWDPSTSGLIKQCAYPAKNFVGSLTAATGTFNIEDPASYVDYTAGQSIVTRESILALKEAGFVEYIPWRSRLSPFWQNQWLEWDYKTSGIPGTGPDVAPEVFFTVQPPGVWDADVSAVTTTRAPGVAAALQALRRVEGTDMVLNKATFIPPPESSTMDQLSHARRLADGSYVVNVASRMMQKEALHHAQCSFFVAIVIVQWADLLICKTRWLSLYHQRMRNPAMNFGLVFETLLAAFLCYIPGIGDALGTRPIRALHWMPAVPFSIMIVVYDEVRKAIMRSTSIARRQGQQVIMEYGWLARNTYY